MRFLLIVFVLLSFSCKKATNTFHEKIISQQRVVVDSSAVEVFDIKYLSDTLKIKGFIAAPSKEVFQNDKKLPAIVYCRGGNRNFGSITNFQLQLISDLASNGFVVLASQLRGSHGSEGEDEFGGNDLNDILNLIEIGKELDFVDANNIGVYGISRGGMNAFQISKLTNNIKASATVGAPTNLFETIKFRPLLYQKVLLSLFNDTLTNKEGYNKRSAVFWHNKINEPLLLLHGREDRRVHVTEAEMLIDSLKNSKKDFEYHIFENGNHALTNYAEKRDSLIINWFKKYLK